MRRLIEQDEIQQRVHTLGEELSELYRGKNLTVIGALTGCMLFMADLVRAIDVPHRIGVVEASSYRGATTRPGELTVDLGLMPDIRGRDVLMIDDIFDTGNTMEKLVAALQCCEPASIRTVALLIKEGRSEVDMKPDFFCFRIPDVFVIGYGLDYNDDYRHLPFIGVLDEADLEQAQVT
ncbi:MAG: hypoxanthine phosphoribosyltransferase [Rhodopirellula sp.]|nr:hypoxanthine phosphoribosyltransferase [Rhodopirellula sp.]